VNQNKVEFKRLITITVFMVLTALVVSGATWIFSGLAERNISNTRNVQLSAMESQLQQLREAVRQKENFEKNREVLGAPETE
jgi:hypothetical protein